jgi:hypothetical protein
MASAELRVHHRAEPFHHAEGIIAMRNARVLHEFDPPRRYVR